MCTNLNCCSFCPGVNNKLKGVLEQDSKISQKAEASWRGMYCCHQRTNEEQLEERGFISLRSLRNYSPLWKGIHDSSLAVGVGLSYRLQGISHGKPLL